jgi:uncharacterized membrane protein
MMIGVQNDSAGQLPDRLTRLEQLVGRDLGVPAWRRHTDGEQRWPSGAAILCMIALQYALPDRLTLGPRWLMPAIELVLIAVLFAANPGRMDRAVMPLRFSGLWLIGLASISNAASVVLLVLDILRDQHTSNAAQLLTTGGAIYLINVLTFAVWYWELDRGGPVERALGNREFPDFLFPQMTAPGMSPKDWEPQFLDYLYVAFTNSTAFSPTDTLPLSRWAKALMGLQSAISLVTAALVIAKAVNALG